MKGPLEMDVVITCRLGGPDDTRLIEL
jgi:hypothetical protein